MSTDSSTYPGGSKSRVNKAGARVRNGEANNEDLIIIETWRAAHRPVLNTFQAILRNRTRGTKIAVAQRHKRRNTIFGKLFRLPKMELSRMDDIAGCRLIFPSCEELYNFRKIFHSARFKHKRRNEADKYDYIKSPKKTGYRGIHDVYEYDVNSHAGDHLRGLYVEIQYRTHIQHAWATAVEVIGFITESQPKFQEGDDRYQHAMALASEVLARAHESKKGPLPDLTDKELVNAFIELDKSLSLMNMLRGLNAADKDVKSNRNTILLFSKSGELQIKTYRDATEALRELFELENSFPDHDIVLVRADSSEEVKFAYKNYFSDARDFITLMENGLQKLSGKKVLKSKKLIGLEG
ncbi:RelA/SpoT domain-containing protein [Pseudomonas sp. BLCC-B13]|uniref:RelA/SpoT domain-containing protein n=1 Tax=Pseudomonas sp. BLCC-B13 TaxID=3025314 RepID=UPI00234E5E9B|nr:RelA/SpoT domain-containing protein [Pseudomonas sp. BLCC-B13]MDC7824440.1 RelA/SpoT domain-containing protein [Pseudomonas sp. BLCC-B13]